MFTYISPGTFSDSVTLVGYMKNKEPVKKPVENIIDFKHVEEDVKIEEEYLDYLFHHKEIS